MIAPFGSSTAFRLLREEAAQLKTSVTTLSAQVTHLSTQAEAERGERDRLEDGAAELKTLFTTLSAQVTLLCTQAAADMERSAAERGERDRLERNVAELKQIVASQADGLAMQAVALAALEVDRNGQAEALRQLRGDLTRLQRQTKIDLGELRETDMVLARAALINRPSYAAGEADGEERTASPVGS